MYLGCRVRLQAWSHCGGKYLGWQATQPVGRHFEGKCLDWQATQPAGRHYEERERRGNPVGYCWVSPNLHFLIVEYVPDCFGLNGCSLAIVHVK